MTSVSRQTLLDYCHQLLSVDTFSDYCPNGLQVEGASQISKIVTGVTASEALIKRAIDEKADALLVHHGYFWKGEAPIIQGMKKRRIALLLQHNINLIAYHLPLDAHPILGNNAQLAKVLGFENVEASDDLVFCGELQESMNADDFNLHISQRLNRQALLVSSGSTQPIKRIAWCTGGAQSYINKAFEKGVDAFISGEISESTVHFARENNIHFIAAGHHATERYGAKALGEHLAEKFSIEQTFIDIDSPA